jgi:dimethylargininase
VRAIVREVSNSFEKALASYFGSGPTNLNEAKLQHSAYVSKLEELGLSVNILPSDLNYPDCCFVEDHAVIAGDSALITNAGHDTRLGEKAVIQEALEKDLKLEFMPSEARMDGGDVLQFGDKFLVGHSSRTNKKAIECLRDFVTSRGFSLHVIEVPKESLHLISICTSPMPGVLLAPEGWFDSSDFPDDSEIIWVPKNEAYGANVLPFGNDVIVAKGYEMISKVLSEKGLNLHQLDMSQFRAADGSLTCLSLLYE